MGDDDNILRPPAWTRPSQRKPAAVTIDAPLPTSDALKTEALQALREVMHNGGRGAQPRVGAAKVILEYLEGRKLGDEEQGELTPEQWAVVAEHAAKKAKAKAG